MVMESAQGMAQLDNTHMEGDIYTDIPPLGATCLPNNAVMFYYYIVGSVAMKFIIYYYRTINVIIVCCCYFLAANSSVSRVVTNQCDGHYITIWTITFSPVVKL